MWIQWIQKIFFYERACQLVLIIRIRIFFLATHTAVKNIKMSTTTMSLALRTDDDNVACHNLFFSQKGLFYILYAASFFLFLLLSYSV